MSGFEDIEVGLKVKADLAELREAIKEFDNSERAIQRLKTATVSVKDNIQAQSAAISTLRRAERARNFEALEGIRLLRSFGSVARDLTQVYQALLLRQISNTQQSVAQKQAYQQLSEKADNLVNALDILGPKNEDVKSGFDDLISSADDLSSTQLKNLIDKIELLATSSGNLSDEELTFLNEKLATLRDVLKETANKENVDKMNELFGAFALGGSAAANIGSFALSLSKNEAAIAALVGTVTKFKPEIAVILLLLFGPEAAKLLGFEIQHAGGPTIENGKVVDRDLINEPPKGPTGVEANITSRFASVPGLRERLQGMGTYLHVDFRGSTINRDVDLENKIKELDAAFKRQYGESLK